MSPLEEIRHSTAHVLAAAVLRLYPNTQLDIGPPTDNGFYYDFDSDMAFTPEIIDEIEKLNLNADAALEKAVRKSNPKNPSVRANIQNERNHMKKKPRTDIITSSEIGCRL